ncbi:hypothetical protein DJ564_05145 [Pseudomonas sp. 31-12]|uniref:hypothetical protein n=1 Tax=Pseudomonas sp. 31-12 TaxID=2201356 RepID=UPI000D6C740E|nr:hypothetical protein [Pseudomonas sp. 31-12]AWM90239.1 hypothetical protein DJ564_05145 [Pseudomonas sp. 31-12]
MNILAYEFTAAQRRVLDRYTRFLGSLQPTFNNIPIVFERRRNSGHQLAVLSSDSRLNNAMFNERYLQEFWKRTEETKRLCNGYVEDLAMFVCESLELTKQTTRNEPMGQVDFNAYTLTRSSTWMLFPPKNVQDLVHELYLRFDNLKSAVRQLKFTNTELYRESFGLNSVFTGAMNHKSCNCHSQPAVVEELFRENGTTPVWDIAYSSRDALVRATEYKADIAALFNGFASVNSQMGLFIEEIHQRMNSVINELLSAKRASRLGELNFKLEAAMEGAHECMVMMNHLEGSLRK